MPTPHVITAISALTPFGTTANACSQALERGTWPPVRDIDPPLGSCCPAAFVAEHDARELLGTRNINQLDRLTRHVGIGMRSLLTTLGMEQAETRRRHLPDDRISIVLGTTGSFQSSLDYEREAIRDACYVQPSLMPNIVLNVPASHAAIRHGIRGSCITLTDGPCSAMKALAMSLTKLKCHQIDLALCGGAEEATSATALVCEALRTRHGLDASSLPVLFEGAVLVALESWTSAKKSGRLPLLGIHACLHRFAAGQPEQALSSCLDSLDTHPDFERATTAHICGPVLPILPEHLTVQHLDGTWPGRAVETGTLGSMLSLLDLALSDRHQTGEVALVIQTDLAGNAAVALVEKSRS